MTYEITRNEQFNSYEITFDGKPSEAVRDLLKANGYRWHKLRGIWYGYKDIADKLNSTDEKMPTATTKAKPANVNKANASASRLNYVAHGIKGKNGEQISGYDNENSAEYLAAWYDFDAVRLEIRLTIKDYKHLRIIPRGCQVRDDSDIMIDYFCNEELIIPATAGAEFLAAAQGLRKNIEVQRKKGEKCGYYRRTVEQAERDADALNIAEQIARGEIADGEQVIAERVKAEQERQERQQAESNKAYAAELLQEGGKYGATVEQHGDTVIYRKAQDVQLFDGVPGWGRVERLETVIAINIKTGEREQVQYAKQDEAQAFYNKFAA